MTTDDRSGAPVVRIAQQALADAEALARGALPDELGGIVVGWWEGDDAAVIRALLPVVDHHAGRTHYKRRHALAQHVLDDYLQAGTDAASGYIGEWHSHPAPQPPSSADRNELSAIVRQTRRPAALIVLALNSQGEAVVHSLVGRPHWPRRAAIERARVERMES